MKKKLFIIGISLVLITSVVISLNLGKERRMQSASANSGYEVETLKKRSLANSISATGTFESNQKTSVSSDLANYKIKTVNVEVGDQVKKGDVLCEFDSEDIEQNLEQAKKDLETAKKQNSINERTAARNVSDAESNRKSQYDMATDGIRNAKENRNDSVQERDDLKKAYEDAKLKVGRLEDKLKTIDQKTNPELYASTQSSLAEAKANRDGLKTQYNAAVTAAKSAKSAYEKAVKERKAADKTNASNIANMEDALTSTRIGNESTIDGFKDQIDTYQKQLKKTVVKAENAGVITSLNVTEGQTYVGGDIAILEDPDGFVITAEIEEYEISDIKEGAPVKIKTEATGDEVLDGKVTYVASASSSQAESLNSSGLTSGGNSGVTYEVKVALDQENERIRLGMSAKMSIVTDEVENVFAVPYEAVQEKESGESFVYVIQDDVKGEEPSKTEIQIETGLESNYYVEIKSDRLEEGMSVYVPIDDSGNSSMDDMMNAFGGRGR